MMREVQSNKLPMADTLLPVRKVSGGEVGEMTSTLSKLILTETSSGVKLSEEARVKRENLFSKLPMAAISLPVKQRPLVLGNGMST